MTSRGKGLRRGDKGIWGDMGDINDSSSGPPCAKSEGLHQGIQPQRRDRRGSHALQPIPALNWTGRGVVVGTVSGKSLYGSGYASNISPLQVDDKGTLWAQWTQPGSTEFSIISLPSSP